MKKWSFAFLIILAAACHSTQEPPTLSQLLSTGKWIDLSYDFSDKTLYWPNNPEGFRLDTQFNGITAGGFYYSSNAIYAPEHGGTHLDAPVHFAEGKWSTDQIPLESLTGEAVVVDVTGKTKVNTDYLISVGDVTDWENKTVKYRMMPSCYSAPDGACFIPMRPNTWVHLQGVTPVWPTFIFHPFTPTLPHGW